MARTRLHIQDKERNITHTRTPCCSTSFIRTSTRSTPTQQASENTHTHAGLLFRARLLPRTKTGLLYKTQARRTRVVLHSLTDVDQLPRCNASQKSKQKRNTHIHPLNSRAGLHVQDKEQKNTRKLRRLTTGIFFTGYPGSVVDANKETHHLPPCRISTIYNDNPRRGGAGGAVGGHNT